MTQPELFTATDAGARIRTITNQIAMTLKQTSNPTNIYQLKANKCIHEAKLMRARFAAGDIDVNEAERKLSRLLLEAETEGRNERRLKDNRQRTGATPMLLPPEDTGYLL